MSSLFVSAYQKLILLIILLLQKSFIFEDGDDYHPERNKIKMASGVTLDDEVKKNKNLCLNEHLDDFFYNKLCSGLPVYQTPK